VIVTKYQYAGEHMITSKEEGPSGVTETKYNGSGQPIETFLTDQWGRTKFTVNEYAKGKIAQSLLTDDKGKTVTTFNKDGDPKKIVRENEIGYPRKTEEERTYKDGMLSVSVSYDVKGKTITYYDENELPVKVHRINYHGFPREHWTYNFYDAGGDVESSVQLDERGQTRNTIGRDFNHTAVFNHHLTFCQFGIFIIIRQCSTFSILTYAGNQTIGIIIRIVCNRILIFRPNAVTFGIISVLGLITVLIALYQHVTIIIILFRYYCRINLATTQKKSAPSRAS